MAMSPSASIGNRQNAHFIPSSRLCLGCWPSAHRASFAQPMLLGREAAENGRKARRSGPTRHDEPLLTAQRLSQPPLVRGESNEAGEAQAANAVGPRLRGATSSCENLRGCRWASFALRDRSNATPSRNWQTTRGLRTAVATQAADADDESSPNCVGSCARVRAQRGNSLPRGWLNVRCGHS